MLVTFAFTLGLLLLASRIGRDVLGTHPASRLAPVSVAWIGIGTWASLLLACSLFEGVSSFVYLPGAVYLLIRGVQARGKLGQIPIATLSSAVAACGAASLYSLRPIVLFDTWLYHLNAVNWSATHGIVPGLGLLHGTLGYVCSWFSLGASVSHGVFEQRLYALPGALALALMVWQTLLSLYASAKGRGTVSDVVFLLGFAVAFAVCWKGRLLASCTPDTAVIGLSLQIFCEGARRFFGELHFERTDLATLLLATVVGFSFKLSFVVFLLPAALGFLVCLSRKSLDRRALFAAGILAVCVAVSVRATGYPFYPVKLARLPLSWALTEQEASKTQDDILVFSRYGSAAGTDAARGFWLFVWARTRPASAMLLLFSVVALAVLASAKQRAARFFVAPGAVALLLFFTKAPDMRYSLGLWCALVAMATALSLRSWIEKRLARSTPGTFVAAGFLAAILPALYLSPDEKAIKAAMGAHQREHLSEWLIPLRPVALTGPDARHLYPTPFQKHTTPAGVEYYLVVDDPGYQGPGNCPGNYHLMATQQPTTEQIAYRDPSKGLAAGFVRSR